MIDRQGRRDDRRRPVLRGRHRRARPRGRRAARPRSGSAEGRYAQRPGEVVIDKGTAEKEGTQRRRHDPDRGQRAGARSSRSSASRVRRVDSIGTATFALFDLARGADAVRQAGRGRRGARRGPAGVDPAALRGVDLAASLPRRRERRHRGRAGPLHARTALTEFIGILQKVLLAFGLVARLRRRVHHLQHAVDHGRPAHARARAAAAIGASRRQVHAVGDDRGAGDRRRSRRWSGWSPGCCVAKGLQRAVPVGRPRAAADRHGVRARGRGSSALLVGVGVTLVAGLSPARARDARAAGRGAARGRDADARRAALDGAGRLIAIATFASASRCSSPARSATASAAAGGSR